ncbi:hypothetical protein GW17_00014912 [Ensete ventricosum]|nr:hypothetical protein GW17_00014912 [Ensete ventricosum]
MQNPHFDHAASINSRTIKALAETFVTNPQENIHWLIECGSYSKQSRTLFFFIIFQALIIINAGYKVVCHTLYPRVLQSLVYIRCFSITKWYVESFSHLLRLTYS